MLKWRLNLISLLENRQLNAFGARCGLSSAIAYSGTASPYTVQYAANANILPDKVCPLRQNGHLQVGYFFSCIHREMCCKNISLQRMIDAVRQMLKRLPEYPLPVEDVSIQDIGIGLKTIISVGFHV